MITRGRKSIHPCGDDRSPEEARGDLLARAELDAAETGPIALADMRERIKKQAAVNLAGAQKALAELEKKA